MKLQLPSKDTADVVLTYVTEAPAWKPSYRVVVGDHRDVMLEGWAIVDNTSGEDWKNVLVGVGSSSALSFRYDLWSVRQVQRETLANEERFAIADTSFANSYFWSSFVRRFASASIASCLLAKPTSPTNRRSCRVEPGPLNRYRQTVFPDRYLRLKTGISSPRLPLVCR
jgi:hypothetical protein